MSKVASWFERQKIRNQRFVSVQDLFFGQKKIAYLIYRVKIFNLQTVIRYLFFCFFFIANYTVLIYKLFSIIAIMVLLQWIISSFWWGALECMRSKIRHDFNAHAETTLDITLGSYLYFSFLVTLILLLIFYSLWHHYIFDSSMPDKIQFFILFYCIKISLSLLLNTFHSGAYAITRIIRTPFSILIPDLIGILVIIILYPLFPEEAALFALVIRSLISMVLIYRFVLRMYHFYELNPVFPSNKAFLRWIKKIPLKEFLLAGLSFVMIKQDMVFIILATLFMENSLISNELFIVLFLVNPMFIATTNWAFLFYFDRKRVKGNDFTQMINYYNKSIEKATIFFALIYWFIALLAVALLISLSACRYLILFLPFFIIKAKLADLQIKRFSYNSYIDIIIAGCFLLGSYTALFIANLNILPSYFLALLSLVVMIKFLQKPRFSIKTERYYKLPINLYNFLYKLTELSDQALTIYYITTSADIHIHQEFYVLNKLSDKFVGDNEEICIIDNSHYLFFTLNKNIPSHKLIEAGVGLIKSIEKSSISNHEHLSNLILNRQEVFQKFLPRFSFKNEDIVSADNIKQRFFETFPKGTCFSPQPEFGREAVPMDLEDIRSLYTQAIQYLFYTRIKRYSLYDITVYYSHMTIECIFSIPRKQYPNSALREWQVFLHKQNIFQSLRLLIKPA